MRLWQKAVLGLALTAGLVGASLAAPGAQDWFTLTLATQGNAMSHGPSPQPGILDEGDLGHHVRKPPREAITPMVAARAAGLPPLAGDWGDVIVFKPPAPPGAEPGRRVLLEHRALAWVRYDAATGLFDVPELGLAGVRELTIPDVGMVDDATGAYVRHDLSIVLARAGPDGMVYPAGQHSGWVTKGDRAAAADQQPGADGRAASALVRPEWVEAKLVRVVDAESLARDVALGLAVTVLGGVALVLLKGALRERRAARAERTDAPPSMPRASTLDRLRGGACDGCGTKWGELSFCARCGAERAPRHRYASAEALEAALAAKAARRR